MLPHQHHGRPYFRRSQPPGGTGHTSAPTKRCGHDGQIRPGTGFEQLPEEELRTLTEQIAFYKAHEELIHHGDLYRLVSAYGSRYAAWQILSEDKNSFILFFFSITGRPNQEPVRIRLQGLDSEAIYEEENGKAFSGATLMQAGLAVDTRFDMKPFIRIFRKK